MTTSADLRKAAVQGLVGQTLAGMNVFSPRDVPTWDGSYPMLIVMVSKGHGESLGNTGVPKFDTTAHLRVIARVEQPAMDGEDSAAIVYEALELLCNQILAALINFPPLKRRISEYPFFNWDLDNIGKEDSGMHQGEAVVEIGMKWTQGPADFFNPPVDSFGIFSASVTTASGTESPGLYIELPPDASGS